MKEIKALSSRLGLLTPNGTTKDEIIERIKAKYTVFKAKNLMTDDFILATCMA
ncbi:unnamed protein product, partial [Choristocarpus tenellus]